MELELLIRGKDATPQALTVGELTALLNDLDKALVSQAKQAAQIPDEEAHLRLMRLGEGSIAAVCVLSEQYPPQALNDILEALGGKVERLAEHTREALSRLQKRIAKRSWQALIQAKEANISLVIDSTTEIPAPPQAVEYTTVYGVLTNIGGDDPPRATLRLPDGTPLTVNLTRSRNKGISLARQLAQRLYQVVGVRGEATVRLTDHVITHMLVTEVVPYAPSRTAEELIAKLQEMGKDLPPPSQIERFYAQLNT